MTQKDNCSFEINRLHIDLSGYLEKHWRFFLAEGVFFIALGINAILIPQFFTEAIVIFLGWLLLFAGVVHVCRALAFVSMPGFGLWLIIGLLQLLVGYLFVVNPLSGVMTLTTLITAFFVLEGVAKISFALLMRPLAHWGALLFSGITAVIFALIVIISWDETAHWLLGVLIGLNMICLGGSLVKMSLHYKNSLS